MKNVVSPLNSFICSAYQLASRSKLAQNEISEYLLCKMLLGGIPLDSHALHVDCVSRNAIRSDIV